MIAVPKLYSQLDTRWFWKPVGGYSYFGAVGCTTVCLTMLLELCGSDLDPLGVEQALSRVGGYLWIEQKPTGLMIWDRVPVAFPAVSFIKRHSTYDDLKVMVLINQGMPVLVQVVHTSGYWHWVLFVGDGLMVDPLGGIIRPVSTYPAIGYSELVRAQSHHIYLPSISQ